MKNIMDILEQTINRQLYRAEGVHDYGLAKVYFHQAFGATEFAMAIINDWEKEAVIVEKWEKEWKPAFEKIMMEV